MSKRRGIALLALVFCVLGMLLTLGVASSYMTSGTGRTLMRIANHRVLLESGEAAIAETVARVRNSMDTNLPHAPACPDNWRKLILEALDKGDQAILSKMVKPEGVRALYKKVAPGLSISDVRVTLVSLYAVSGGHRDHLHPPQGILEMAVDVSQSQGLMTREATRTVKQRRVFWVSESPGGILVDPTRASALITLVSDPLATVVQ